MNGSMCAAARAFHRKPARMEYIQYGPSPPFPSRRPPTNWTRADGCSLSLSLSLSLWKQNLASSPLSFWRCLSLSLFGGWRGPSSCSGTITKSYDFFPFPLSSAQQDCSVSSDLVRSFVVTAAKAKAGGEAAAAGSGNSRSWTSSSFRKVHAAE